MEGFVPREEFRQYRDSIDRRFQDYEKRIDRTHQSLHDLRNDLIPIFALPDRMDELVSDLKNVPRKEDLDYITKSVNTGFENLSSQRLASERRLTRNIAIISLIASIIVSVVVALLNAAKH